ncbi:geranylgeranylglycerol-phosphate geranylgeranyltransferase [Croceiramulus getboli]|nr:geranylgeranylglycerol-phosphate geranylgeranyltransferase [Flavobacteriaceae bacterium YJPT1-3]
MSTAANNRLFLKLFGLFSVVRGYNILVITLAQYLSAIYILSPELPVREVLFDPNLFLLVLSSGLTIAAGYIINNFYDSEKDLINRPRKTMLDRVVSQRTKIVFYFVLNFLSIIVASYVSFRAVLFFSIYIFGIWIYSHRLKKIPFIGNLTSAILAVTPFFAVFIYYANFELVIFVHATFLFLVLAMREMVKDLENMRGDLAQNYRTIPIVFGERTAKSLLTALVGLTVIPIYLLINYFEIGHMYLYFYASVVLLLLFLALLWRSRSRPHYLLLHNILKLIVVAGVFCILLIDIDVVLNRI